MINLFVLISLGGLLASLSVELNQSDIRPQPSALAANIEKSQCFRGITITPLRLVGRWPSHFL